MSETETQAQSQTQVLDLDMIDTALLPEDIEINPDANPFAAPPPPDDGTHRVKLAVVDNSFEHSQTRPDNNGNRRAFIKFKVTGTILDEGSKNNNKRVFDNVNTLTFDGKSYLGGILIAALGGTPEAKAQIGAIKNYVELAKAAKRILAGEPIVRVVTKWVAQRKITDASGKEKDKYEVVKSGQKSFAKINPADPNSDHNPVFFDSKTGTEVKAQAVVQEYMPDAGAA
jgi:hypothetical protein